MASSEAPRSEIHATVLRSQRNELTEHLIYRRLAAETREEANRGVLQAIADDELRRYRQHASVAQGVPFRRRFLGMAAISLGVAAPSFAIGWVVREVSGVEV